MKKLALLLVALLVAPMLLTACGSESQDAAKDYLEAMFKGDIEDAEDYVCDDFVINIDGLESTADLHDNVPFLGPDNEVRNIHLKFDLGKGNNAEEVIVTGAYDIVDLNDSGKMITDSEEEYELAASVRDKRDLNENDDDADTMDTRILLEMSEDGDWCVESLEGGFWDPQFSEDEDADAEMEDADDADMEDADETAEDSETSEDD